MRGVEDAYCQCFQKPLGHETDFIAIPQPVRELQRLAKRQSVFKLSISVHEHLAMCSVCIAPLCAPTLSRRFPDPRPAMGQRPCQPELSERRLSTRSTPQIQWGAWPDSCAGRLDGGSPTSLARVGEKPHHHSLTQHQKKPAIPRFQSKCRVGQMHQKEASPQRAGASCPQQTRIDSTTIHSR